MTPRAQQRYGSTNMETLDELNQILINCRLCPCLVAWREQVAHHKRKAYQDQVYWGRPVLGLATLPGG